jgi:hypothetical protein
MKNAHPFLSELESSLYNSVLDICSGFKEKDQFYCLVLAYDVEHPLPPVLGLGLESERTNWIEEEKKDAKDFIWNPAEFTHFDIEELEIVSRETKRLCLDWDRKTNEPGKLPGARKILIDIAKKLNELDWSKHLVVTTDFIVYTVDFEGTDLKENFAHILSESQVQNFKNKKIF